MSNLKQRVKQIQQQLVISTAETVARFREAKATMDERFAEVHEALARLQNSMRESTETLENALIDQGEKNRIALDQLLELIVEQDRETQKKLADHEARLRRLEGAA